MAGEIALPPVQPGGRAPAPGELAFVQAFINTHYDLEVSHGAEVLATPEALRRWLIDRGLLDGAASVNRRDLAWAIELREALRDLARGDADAPAALDDLAAGAPVELRFAAGPGFAPAKSGGVGAAFGMLLAITARAMLDGTWRRLKICPGHDCDWAFYDHSRNMTGRWCSMSVCGGRAKARSHYLRQRAREVRS
jgi:predicted RNA-binding Zn ribbon-like protein